MNLREFELILGAIAGWEGAKYLVRKWEVWRNQP